MWLLGYLSLQLTAASDGTEQIGIHALGTHFCQWQSGPFTTERIMDEIEAHFANAARLATGQEGDPFEIQVRRYSNVGNLLTELLSYECCFEDNFVDCAPVYFAGYTLIASSDEFNRQEYAIRALRFADLVAHRRGSWCEAELLSAFQKRWPHADRSSFFAVDWAECGATAALLSWKEVLLSLCANSMQLLDTAAEHLESHLHRPRRPEPLSASLFCAPHYLVIPPLTTETSLRDFHASLSPRLAMVSTPLWSREIQSSCPKHFQCAMHGHFLLVEALRYVGFQRGALFLEFGSAHGQSTNITAKYLQSVVEISCREQTTTAQALTDCMRTMTPTVNAFDSFLGLPKDWFEWKQGSFSRGGTLPPVERNVKFYEGWFNESLLKLETDLQATQQQISSSGSQLHAGFVYIDCDLYESTTDALRGLEGMKLLKPGTVLAFDELIHHTSAFGHLGELAALYELLLEFPRPVQLFVGAWRRSSQEVGGGAVLRLL